jgi:ribokinase
MPIRDTRDPPASVFIIGSLVVSCSARVTRCPEAGETLEATDFIMEAGGKGFNVALAAHRLGVPVNGLFAVGSDPAGQFMRQAFVDLGLDADMLLTIAAPTGAGVGLIQADGENRIAVYPGANAELSAAHVDAKAGPQLDASLVFAQFEAPDAPIATAFALARRRGIATMLNPSPYRSIPRHILAATDILVVNEQEAAALGMDMFWTGSQAELARHLAAAGVGTLVVTRGAQGAVAWRHGEAFDQTAFPVAVVDSIGAGDAFNGAMIAALIEREEFAIALKWGCAAGALTASAVGVARALPDRAAIGSLIGR